MNKRINIKIVDNVEGFPVNVTETSLPWPLTNRVYVATTYDYDMPDGSTITVQSDVMNEELTEKHKAKLGKNVLMRHHLSCTRLVPREGGCICQQLILIDAGGSIPGKIKDMVSNR